MRRLIVIVILISVSIVVESQNSSGIDSLYRILDNTTNDTNRIKVYLELGDKYLSYNNFAKAQMFYRYALPIANRLDTSNYLSIVYSRLGNSFLKQGHYEEAKKMLYQALYKCRSDSDSLQYAEILSKIGVMYFFQDVYDSALYYNISALKIFWANKKYQKLLNSYNIIANISVEIKNYEAAEYYYNEALKLSDSVENKAYKVSILTNMGIMYRKQGQLLLAERITKEAIELAKENDYEYYLANLYQNLADIYIAEQKYYIAINYLAKAKEFFAKIDDYERLTDAYISMAKAFYYLRMPHIAYNYLYKVKQLMKKNRTSFGLSTEIEYYKILSEIEFELKRKGLAYKHLKKYSILKDSLYDVEKAKFIYELEYKYKSIDNSKVIESLIKVNNLTSELLERKEQQRKLNVMITLLLMLIVLVLILAMSVIIQNLKKNKLLNSQLQIQNRKIIEAQNKLQNVVDSIPEIFFQIDDQNKIIFANNNFYIKTGVNPQIPNPQLTDLVDETYLDEFENIKNKAIVEATTQSLELKLKSADNKYFWALISLTAKGIPEDRQFYGMIMDITKRKKAEEDLLLLKTSVEQSMVSVFITDRDAKIIYVTHNYLERTGYSMDEFLNKTPRFLNSGMTSQALYKKMWETITQGKVWKGVFINKRKDGTLFYDETIITPVQKDGKITHYIATKVDITDEIEKNELLNKLFTATEKSPAAVIMLNNNAEITYVNKAFERYTQYEENEVIGRKLDFLMPSEQDKKENAEMFSKLYSGKNIETLLKRRRKDGKIIFVQSVAIPLFNDENKLIGFVFNELNITERIRMEEKLKETLEELHLKNKEILDSLRYAEHIQLALMSNRTKLSKIFQENLVLFLPKDIISGDFFWSYYSDNKAYLAVVDCTGHGVPGSFLSILGVTFLETAVKDSSIVQPSDILNFMSRRLRRILSPANSNVSFRDDMEISLLVIDFDNSTLAYASSRNRMYLITKQEISQDKKIKLLYSNNSKKMYSIKGEREFLIGKRSDFRFTDIILPYSKNDLIYFSTDGYYDQFGQQKQEKFKRTRFEKLLFEMSDLSLSEQEKLLLKTLIAHKGACEQTDDITVIGVRLQ